MGFTAALVRMAGRTTPTSSPTVRSRARAFTGVVIVELMTIAVTVVVLSALDAAAFIPGAVALVVGAHFFALAKVFDLPLYRLTGSWLCVVAVGALGTSVFDGPAGQAVAGTGAATALWTTAWALACGRVRRGAR